MPREARGPEAIEMSSSNQRASSGSIGAAALCVCVLALPAVVGAQDQQPLPRGGETVNLNPADFSTRIDNAYWPMRPGSRWVYREKSRDGSVARVVVTVLSRTRRIANGITARAVSDVVTEGGKLVEVTEDWYAQDRAGNVWYMGEKTKEYENGKVKSTAGSFEAGVDGAQPGIAMPANPRPGIAYRQEYYKGQAEDRAAIVSTGDQAQTRAGHFRNVVVTKDTNPLEPRILELKFYARGVGPVLELGISGGGDRTELVSYRRGRG
jgi:hypothetical protein